MHIELFCPFVKVSDLLLLVLGLIVLHSFVYVALSVLEHAIDDAGEFVSHGGNGLGGPEASTETSVVGT